MKVALCLSDPWEIGEAIGWPTLVGTVVHRDPKAWLVELDHPFKFAGVEYRFLVASARHEDSSLESSVSKEVSCNLTRTDPERVTGKNPCDLSWWRGGGAMIGSIAVSLVPKRA
jgi:hypothetical protein